MSPRFSGTIIDNKVHSTFLSSDKKNNLKSPLLSDTSPNIARLVTCCEKTLMPTTESWLVWFLLLETTAGINELSSYIAYEFILRRAPGEYFLLGCNPLRNSLFLAQYRIKLKTLTWSSLHIMCTVLATIFKVIHTILSPLAARGAEAARKAEDHAHRHVPHEILKFQPKFNDFFF